MRAELVSGRQEFRPQLFHSLVQRVELLVGLRVRREVVCEQLNREILTAAARVGRVSDLASGDDHHFGERLANIGEEQGSYALH